MKYIYSFLLLMVSSLIFAQNEVDALRYSFIRHGGTARYTAMSGAFGALGSDFSSLSTNPAGIATFKGSVKMMMSPSFFTSTVNSKYRNEEIEDDNLNFSFNNMGLIIAIQSDDLNDSDWKNICFGIGYNRFLNLSNNIRIKGYSEESSMLDQFAINSNGYTPDNLFDEYQEVEWLAWEARLTGVMEGSTDNTYDHQYFYKTYVHQEKKIKNRGGVGEYVFSIGGNYRNKLQVGASVGIQAINFESNSEYTESSDSTDLSSYTFGENLRTSGTGFNLKVGLIYIPVRFLRLGAAIHTPTFYNLTDIYSYSMESNWRTPIDGEIRYKYDTEDFNDNGTTENEFTYGLFTPYRFIGSAALVVSRFAILSADYEYVDYSLARLKSVEDNFSKQNDNIKNLYTSAQNIRLGAEVRLAPLYLRGGASYYGSPYSQEFEAKGSVKSYSFGLGLKTRSLYFDLAFEHSEHSMDYKMFDYIKFLDNGNTEVASEVAELSFQQNYLGLTVGYRF